MPFLLVIIFFSILFFFGWQLAQYSLKEKRIEYLIGLAGILGIGLYVFFINAAGFFVQIKIVFYLVLLLFFILGLVLFYFNKSKPLEWGIDRRWRKILLGFTLFLVVATGIISFRHPMDLSILREPTAATMAEGNFPPVEIWRPEHSLSYHYAPDLFSASIRKVTGVPIYLAHDLQKAILTGVLFLLGFMLIKRFSRNDFKAFIASLLMFYAGTLVFLRGLTGIPILYNKYILHQDIPGAFKFVSDAIEIGYASPVIRFVAELHWGAMAFPLIIAIIYLYFNLVNEKTRRIAFPICGFLLALLALVSEPYFVVLSFILFIYPLAFGFIKKDWERTKKFLLASFLILLIAVPFALMQGGLLKDAFTQQLGLTFTKDYLSYVNGYGNTGKLFKISAPWVLFDSKPIYNPEFLVAWGLLFVLLIPSLIFLFKRYFELTLFLTGVLIVSFSIPILVTSDHIQMSGQLERLFNPVSLLGGLAAGLYLGSLYLRVQKVILKRAILFLILILMAQALWTQSVWLIFGYPPGTWNANAKLFAKTNSLEGSAASWVKENTSIDDYFLIIKEDYTDCGLSGAANCLFVFNAGRMAPTYNSHLRRLYKNELPPVPEADLFEKVKKSCDSSIIKKLNYRYLYVNEKWRTGMEEKCLENNETELKFEASKGNKFVRIYKIK